MPKFLPYILIVVAALVVLYFLFGREEAAAAPSITGAGAGVGSVSAGSTMLEQLGDILEEPQVFSKKGCKQLCKSLCKGFGKGQRGVRTRRDCKLPCQSDCAKGLDVSSIYP